MSLLHCYLYKTISSVIFLTFLVVFCPLSQNSALVSVLCSSLRPTCPNHLNIVLRSYSSRPSCALLTTSPFEIPFYHLMPIRYLSILTSDSINSAASCFVVTQVSVPYRSTDLTHAVFCCQAGYSGSLINLPVPFSSSRHKLSSLSLQLLFLRHIV